MASSIILTGVKGTEGECSYDFVEILAADGWLGSLVPEEYDCVGMSISGGVIMMEKIAASNGGSADPEPKWWDLHHCPSCRVRRCGIQTPSLSDVTGDEIRIQAFELTDPNADLNSPTWKFVHGEGVEHMLSTEKSGSPGRFERLHLLMARTTPLKVLQKRTPDILMFLVLLEDAYKQGSKPSPYPRPRITLLFYEIWFNDVHVPAANLIGEEGNSLYKMIDDLNGEQLFVAAVMLGTRGAALQSGIDYANNREIFGHPIGTHRVI